MNARSVALKCPECGAPAELRSVLTDRGFAVARVALIAHLEEAHGFSMESAEAAVEKLRWEAGEGTPDDSH